MITWEIMTRAAPPNIAGVMKKPRRNEDEESRPPPLSGIESPELDAP